MLNAFFAFIAPYRVQITLLGIVVAVLVLGFLIAYCGKSATEKRIENRSPVLQEQQAGINTAEKLATNANATAGNATNVAIQAEANANKIRAERQTNVSVDTANRSRCAAFPESADCK